MLELESKLWVKKYQPTSLTDYIFQNKQQKDLVQSIITERMVGHALFSGIQGTGKTSLSNVLVKELEVLPSDVLRINCSDESSIDTIRTKVIGFTSVFPDGEFRVVQLEECDYLSKNAQASLRVLLEESVDRAKFILTCNYVHKILPALKSRCQYQFDFKAPDKREIIRRVIEIMMKEDIKFDQNLIMTYIDACYPDMRKIIQTIQQHCVAGELQPYTAGGGNDDYKFKLLEHLEKDEWTKMREIVCSQVSDDEMEEVYKFLYQNIDKCSRFKNTDNYEQAIVIIAKYLKSDGMVAVREINLAALFIELGTI